MNKQFSKIKFKLSLTILLGIMLIAGLVLAETKSDYKQAITNLNELLSSTPALKQQINKALEIQAKGSYWSGKTSADFVNFFAEWLSSDPLPTDPGKYVKIFDELANSGAGEILFNNNVFSSWFIEFLNARGEYFNTKLSAKNMSTWMASPITKIENYNVPAGGFKTYNELFLRKIKPEARPLSGQGDPAVIVSPADGTMHQIYAEDLDSNFTVKRDDINIRQALNNSPYAERFIGGKMVDILLWFTDYHHFHSPVSGKIVALGEYPGSYNYNFKKPTWYKELAKHKRLCYIIQTKEHGLVAMIPIGFWGVGSTITERQLGDQVQKGDELGHFAYGGSSILLIFEPGAVKFSPPVGKKPIPVQVRKQIGIFTKPAAK